MINNYTQSTKSIKIFENNNFFEFSLTLPQKLLGYFSYQSPDNMVGSGYKETISHLTVVFWSRSRIHAMDMVFWKELCYKYPGLHLYKVSAERHLKKYVEYLLHVYYFVSIIFLNPVSLIKTPLSLLVLNIN